MPKKEIASCMPSMPIMKQGFFWRITFQETLLQLDCEMCGGSLVAKFAVHSKARIYRSKLVLMDLLINLS